MYYLNLDALEIIADGSVEIAETAPQYPINEAATEALNAEGGQLRFYSGSKYPWIAASIGNRTVAQSVNHRGLSKGYVATVITIDEPGRLSFDWMNSCEAGFDYLTLYINDEVAYEMRNVNSTFENVIIDLPNAGEYSLAWVYSKDDEISEYDDCSFLDNVTMLEAIHPTSFETEAFIGLHAGERQRINFTLLPQDTTVKTIIWSSSDESIASVDENGFVTAVAMGSAVITGRTLDGDITDMVNITVMAPYAEQTIYGYRYISSTGGRFDLVSFSDSNPETFETVASLASQSYVFQTMEYVNGKIYAACGCRIFSMDLGTFEPAMIHDETQDGVEIMDMTYSYADSSMYLLLSSNSQSAIYVMDLETGSSTLRTVVSGISMPLNTLAIGPDGRAYCTQMYSENLYSVDLSMGAATLIGSTSITSSKYQSMTFDHATGRLLLACCSIASGHVVGDDLYIVDPNNATVTSIGNLNGTNETQLVGMFTIPDGDMQSFTVDYVNSITGEVMVSNTVERGSILTEFPEVTPPQGHMLSGWVYDGSPIVSHASIFALFDLLGDIDYSGTLTAADALGIMRHSLNLALLTDNALIRADVNQDGNVNVDDALLVLRSTLGI